MKSSLIKSIIAVALGLLSIVIYTAWYFVVAEESAHAVDIAQKVSAKNAIQVRTVAARAVLTELSDNEDFISKHFVSENSIVRFLSDLQERGSGVGAEVNILSVSANQTKEKTPHVQIALQIKGSFQAVMNAVGRIEYAPYGISINSLAIGIGKVTENENTIWNANIALSAGSIVDIIDKKP